MMIKKKCPNCGAIVESKFCTSCGKDLTGPEIIKICPNCGTETASKFCTGCGTKLVDDVAQVSKDNVPTESVPISEKNEKVSETIAKAGVSAAELLNKAKKLGAQKVNDLEKSAEAKRALKEKEAELLSEKKEREAELLREQQKREAELRLEQQKREAELRLEQQKREAELRLEKQRKEAEQRREEERRAEEERKLQLEKERKEAKQREEEEERKKLLKKKRTYEEAAAYMNSAENADDNKVAAVFFRKAEKLFSEIPGWEDSDEKGAFCARRAKEEEIIVEKLLIEKNKEESTVSEKDVIPVEDSLVEEEDVPLKENVEKETSSGEQIEKTNDEAGGKKKSKAVIVIVIIAVIVLAGILVALLGGNEDKEQVSNNEVTTTDTEDTEESDDTDGTVSADNGALKPIGISVEAEEDGYIYYYVTVKNNTKGIINAVSTDITYLNEDGDIIDSSYPSNSSRVLPGQSVKIEGLVEVGEAKRIQIDQFSFTNEKGDYIEGTFDKSLEAVDLTKPGETEYESETEYSDSEVSKEITISDEESPITIKELKSDGESDGYKNFSATITNNTDSTINTVGLNMVLLDSKGNICGETYPTIDNRVEPGQSIKIEGITDYADAEYFTVDGYSYYEGDSDDGEGVDGFFPTIPKAVKL